MPIPQQVIVEEGSHHVINTPQVKTYDKKFELIPKKKIQSEQKDQFQTKQDKIKQMMIEQSEINKLHSQNALINGLLFNNKLTFNDILKYDNFENMIQ